MDDVCAVCLESCDAGVAAFPGCEHRFHTLCLLNCAQYDVRCPVCRHVPEGVVAPGNTLLLHLEEARDAHRDAFREWRRYTERRRRLLRQHPALKAAFDELKQLRATFAREARRVERSYDRRCRLAWRTDPDIVAARRDLARMRRRERTLVRFLTGALEASLGPEP